MQHFPNGTSERSDLSTEVAKLDSPEVIRRLPNGTLDEYKIVSTVGSTFPIVRYCMKGVPVQCLPCGINASMSKSYSKASPKRSLETGCRVLLRYTEGIQ